MLGARALGQMLLFYLRHHLQRFKIENVQFGPNIIAAGVLIPVLVGDALHTACDTLYLLARS